MEILANLGNLKDGHAVLVTEKAGHIEFVLATNFDNEKQTWDSGTYLYDMESLAKAILYIEMPIGWDRMSEIASKAIDGLREDDEEEAVEYLINEVELDHDELEYFGIERGDDDDI